MSRSLIVEQKGCPNPGDGGSGKEEVRDKDPHFNHEPHREPYREINETHEQNQFVSGIEREAVAAKPHQGGAVRWDIRRRPLMLGWGDGAHGFSVSPEECL
jgi:hypothetical protein